MNRLLFISLLVVGVYASPASANETRNAVTAQPWQEVVVSVTDVDTTARFFREIGGYEQKWRGSLTAGQIKSWGLPSEAAGESLLLGPPGEETGLLRLIDFNNAGRQQPMRPGSRAWDTGCYFSIMVRMKNMQSIYDDAIALGWWTETPITYLEFGTSKLNVVIFRGPDGVQVQGYERLEPALPDAIPPFERMTRPFNLMQMVKSRDETYELFTQTLGFATFYHGKPYIAETAEFMPLGIPLNLTTSVRYQAGIVYPQPGEFGRLEAIEIMDLEGRDFSEQCHAPNLGILAVRFPVTDTEKAAALLTKRGQRLSSDIKQFELAPYGQVKAFDIHTPDGALMQFFQPR